MPAFSLLVAASSFISTHRAATIGAPCRLGAPACQTLPPGFVWADDFSEDGTLETEFSKVSATLKGGDADGAASLKPVDPMQLDVVHNADEVASVVCKRLETAAAAAIADRGHFALAIPGGSVMKMLSGTAPSWADKCTLVYVNHKAVPTDDATLSTHAKASQLFLNEGWSGANIITLSGSSDAAAEAESYAAALQALPEATLPRGADGLPVFDLMLIGVGDDGHVGSLYPGMLPRTRTPALERAWHMLYRAWTPASGPPSLRGQRDRLS